MKGRKPRVVHFSDEMDTSSEVKSEAKGLATKENGVDNSITESKKVNTRKTDLIVNSNKTNTGDNDNENSGIRSSLRIKTRKSISKSEEGQVADDELKFNDKEQKVIKQKATALSNVEGRGRKGKVIIEKLCDSQEKESASEDGKDCYNGESLEKNLVPNSDDGNNVKHLEKLEGDSSKKSGDSIGNGHDIHSTDSNVANSQNSVSPRKSVNTSPRKSLRKSPLKNGVANRLSSPQKRTPPEGCSTLDKWLKKPTTLEGKDPASPVLSNSQKASLERLFSEEISSVSPTKNRSLVITQPVVMVEDSQQYSPDTFTTTSARKDNLNNDIKHCVSIEETPDKEVLTADKLPPVIIDKAIKNLTTELGVSKLEPIVKLHKVTTDDLVVCSANNSPDKIKVKQSSENNGEKFDSVKETSNKNTEAIESMDVTNDIVEKSAGFTNILTSSQESLGFPIGCEEENNLDEVPSKANGMNKADVTSNDCVSPMMEEETSKCSSTENTNVETESQSVSDWVLIPSQDDSSASLNTSQSSDNGSFSETENRKSKHSRRKESKPKRFIIKEGSQRNLKKKFTRVPLTGVVPTTESKHNDSQKPKRGRPKKNLNQSSQSSECSDLPLSEPLFSSSSEKVEVVDIGRKFNDNKDSTQSKILNIVKNDEPCSLSKMCDSENLVPLSDTPKCDENVVTESDKIELDKEHVESEVEVIDVEISQITCSPVKSLNNSQISNSGRKRKRKDRLSSLLNIDMRTSPIHKKSLRSSKPVLRAKLNRVDRLKLKRTLKTAVSQNPKSLKRNTEKGSSVLAKAHNSPSESEIVILDNNNTSSPEKTVTGGKKHSKVMQKSLKEKALCEAVVIGTITEQENVNNEEEGKHPEKNEPETEDGEKKTLGIDSEVIEKDIVASSESTVEHVTSGDNNKEDKEKKNTESVEDNQTEPNDNCLDHSSDTRKLVEQEKTGLLQEVPTTQLDHSSIDITKSPKQSVDETSECLGELPEDPIPSETITQNKDGSTQKPVWSVMRVSPPKKGRAFDPPETPTSSVSHKVGMTRADYIMQKSRMLLGRRTRTPPEGARTLVKPIR